MKNVFGWCSILILVMSLASDCLAARTPCCGLPVPQQCPGCYDPGHCNPASAHYNCHDPWWFSMLHGTKAAKTAATAPAGAKASGTHVPGQGWVRQYPIRCCGYHCPCDSPDHCNPASVHYNCHDPWWFSQNHSGVPAGAPGAPATTANRPVPCCGTHDCRCFNPGHCNPASEHYNCHDPWWFNLLHGGDIYSPGYVQAWIDVNLQRGANNPYAQDVGKFRGDVEHWLKVALTARNAEARAQAVKMLRIMAPELPQRPLPQDGH